MTTNKYQLCKEIWASPDIGLPKTLRQARTAVRASPLLDELTLTDGCINVYWTRYRRELGIAKTYRPRKSKDEPRVE